MNLLQSFKRNCVGILICCLLLNSCMTPQVIVKNKPQQSQRIRIAVLPFKDAEGHPGSGTVAAEAMTTYLLSIPSYEMIERSALDQIIKEQSFSITGAIDPKTAANIGSLLGADALVIGAVTQYQERRTMILPPAKVTLTARMVRTETGTVDWSGTYTLGWHPIKWPMSFFWPLAVIFIFTSPSAQDRLEKAAKGIAKEVSVKIQEPKKR